VAQAQEVQAQEVVLVQVQAQEVALRLAQELPQEVEMELVSGLAGLAAGLALGRVRQAPRSLKEWESECLMLTALVEAYRSELAEVREQLLESRSQLDSLLEKESAPRLAMDSTQELVMGLRLVQVTETDLARETDLAQEKRLGLELGRE